MLVDAIEPSPHVLERVGVCDVKAQDDALGLSVEVDGQSSKSVLTSSIPNLHLHVRICRGVIWLEVFSDVLEA